MSHFYPEVHVKKIKELRERLPQEIYIEHIPFIANYAVTAEPVRYTERKKLKYRSIREGMNWGKTWESGWFHLQARVPKSWQGSYVIARLDFNGETLIYDTQGNELAGLTNSSALDPSYHKDILHLFKKCQGGEKIELWAEAAANNLFGVTRCIDPSRLEDKNKLHGDFTGHVNFMRLCRFDYDKWQLILDLQVLNSLQATLPEMSVRRWQILRGVSKAIDLFATHGARACREALKEVFKVPSDPATVDIYGVGHAHIDTAWLWPVRETIRKCGRTFASQLDMIKRYPGYIFGASQAQLYDFTKQHYPGLYKRIKKAIAAGRWEVQGGMWVEADCNLIGGESMVRQFLVGKNFFRDEFGVEVKNLWLPDVFGYSGNLPQIMRKAGVEYFLTQKLSWNHYNNFPHNTFFWRGIDGTKVLAHFPPEDSYNSRVMPEWLKRHEWNNKERGLVKEGICLFGVGDGGGGPQEEHIERALRVRNTNGLPRFHFGKAQPVLEKMEQYGDELATWSGELYFECHRGTFTSQAGIKLWNRRAEEALRAAEMLCACVDASSYPRKEFERLWKTVLINQFHDIIPGSSINKVYAEAIPQLQQVVKRAKELSKIAAKKLLKRDSKTLTVFNPSTESFEAIVQLPEGWKGVITDDGSQITAQQEGGNTFVKVFAPGQKFVSLIRDDRQAAPQVKISKIASSVGRILENQYIRYEFDQKLHLIRAYDKQFDKELVPFGEKGNRFELFDDHPPAYDAWDIEEYYVKQRLAEPELVSIKLISGSLRSGLHVTLKIGERSVIEQQIWLSDSSRRLDFVTQIDWQEQHKFLRVAFPTTIMSAVASSEIQYGFVQRATVDNTKWDYAQFECLAHRYADLSQNDYGVALLNDCKYGYRVKGGSLELSLLRSPTDPDPVADLGEHHFIYSLLPHAGNITNPEIRAHAAALNQGVEIFEGVKVDSYAKLPVMISGDGMELAVVKRAEKNNDLIVRVVETRGCDATGTLMCEDKKAHIVPTDLMEWRDEPKKKSRGKMALKLSPFEIQTYRIHMLD